MPESNALGEYLRARRQLVNAADVGLRVNGVRRTPGLGREEVAAAGSETSAREVVPAGILQLLDVTGLPALVEGSLFAVVVTNRLAQSSA